MERPPLSMGSRLEGELLEVSMGPQHPSTHGVFRMNVALDGEIIRKLKPVFGYLHRNHEKIGETPVTSARCRTPTGSIISAR
jgi:NADH:ubiquinone oxidoreductase 49 kD subunit 7